MTTHLTFALRLRARVGQHLVGLAALLPFLVVGGIRTARADTLIAAVTATCDGTRPPSGTPIGNSESFLGENRLRINLRGCNTTALWQIPDQTDFFLGRQVNGTGCKVGDQSLWRFKMNWSTNELAPDVNVFPTPQTIGDGNLIHSAYDPSVFRFNGELWVAFECSVGSKVNSCIGPYNPTTAKVDPTRTNLVVRDASSVPNDRFSYTASVPKLLNFNGDAYLYWTAAKREPKGTNKILSLETHGAKLAQESSGRKRMWVVGATTAIASNDPKYSRVVWALRPDSRSNVTADVHGVFTDGVHIFVTAALGGNKCAEPDTQGKIDGCYRLAISRTYAPLVSGGFGGGDRLDERYLISNGEGYTRMYRRPDGSRNLMGQYLLPAAHAQNRSPTGFYSYPIPDDALYFKRELVPTASSRVPVTFPQLADFIASCKSIPSAACMLASSRACKYSYGNAAGFGPVDALGQNAAIGCVAKNVAAAVTVPWSTLKAFPVGCQGPSNASSVSCNAAVHRYCVGKGYASGLAIEEYSSTAAEFSCVKSCGAKAFSVPWSQLSRSGCNFTNAKKTPGICISAASHYCVDHGYVTGFGVQEYTSSAGQVVCLAAS